MMKKRTTKFVTAAALLLSMTACSGKQYTTTQQTTSSGAGIGALAGAILGQAIGRDTGSTIIGGAIGAGVGALTGFVFGTYLDQQEKELRAQFASSDDVTITRPSENELMITFDSTTSFDTNSAALSLAAARNLQHASTVLNSYPETAVIIRGHTDDTGAAEYNLDLSNRRAMSVQEALTSNSVLSERLISSGYGESQPIATNGTEAGRSQNRRVELLIKKLKG